MRGNVSPFYHMNHIITLFAALALTLSCGKPQEQQPAVDPVTENPENGNGSDNGGSNGSDNGSGGSTTVSGPAVEKTGAKTIVVWYSYTGNTKGIVSELRSQRKADALEIQPAEEGLDYAANNYALGSSLISAIKAKPGDASSYPSIKDSEVDLTQYDTVIVATPLWWSQMAAPMQSFLFKHGQSMSGKAVGLVVSSYSSGISSVESDARRLISGGNFLASSLWISNSNLSNKASLIKAWLSSITPSIPTTNTMKITIGDKTATATLVDNSSTAAIKEILAKKNITYTADDYGNFEKVGDIGETIPQNNEQINTVAGDIILYLGKNVCLYYGTNSWNFTRLGKIDGMSTDEIKAFLKAGEGEIKVTLSL